MHGAAACDAEPAARGGGETRHDVARQEFALPKLDRREVAVGERAELEVQVYIARAAALPRRPRDDRRRPRSAKSLLEPRVVAYGGEVVVSARVLAEPRE